MYSPRKGPLPSSLLNNPEFKPVLKAAQVKLMQLFGNIPEIITSPHLTANLLLLPHAALLDLLSSYELITDCEDSVLMILSWWLEGETGTVCTCEAHQLSELIEVIRFSCLSATYLAQAFLLAPRLKPTELQLAELNHAKSFSPAQFLIYSKDVKLACSKSWFKPERPLTTAKTRNPAVVTLSISTAQLIIHIAQVHRLREGGPAPVSLTATGDYKGLSITLKFSSCSMQSGVAAHFRASVSVNTRLPHYNSMISLPHGIPCSFNLSIHSNVPSKPTYTLRQPTRFVSKDLGWSNFAQVASKLEGSPLVLSWWAPFIMNGHVKLTVEVEDERLIMR